LPSGKLASMAWIRSRTVSMLDGRCVWVASRGSRGNKVRGPNFHADSMMADYNPLRSCDKAVACVGTTGAMACGLKVLYYIV
jgi:hypothetical protein